MVPTVYTLKVLADKELKFGHISLWSTCTCHDYRNICRNIRHNGADILVFLGICALHNTARSA